MAGAAQVLAIVRRVTSKGVTTTTRSDFVTSRPASEMDPTAFLILRREQWGIESVLHQQLDVSLHEDRTRVRTPRGVAVMGVLNRLSVALFHGDRESLRVKRDRTFPVWSGRLQHRPRPMLDRMLRRCLGS